uniref:cell envelope integrity protein CreD n=1 Tax=Roseivirga sp. TaxID=1964215 RepID=UPI0040487C8A
MEQKEESLFEKVNTTIKNSVTIKLLSIGILIAILLIPNSMIKSLITERQMSQFEAIEEVSEKWGAPLEIASPILTIPFNRMNTDKDGSYTTKHFAHFLPTALNINGNLNPEIRKRGIYEVIVYNTQLKLEGNFDEIDFDDFHINESQILWEEAFVSIGIPDMSGIQSAIPLNFNNDTYKTESGIPVTDIVSSGVNARVNLTKPEKAIPFSLNLNINGTKSLSFLPLGKNTNVQVTSNWPHPSFDGQFLPDDYEITKEGFTAKWSVFDLNRNYPQHWEGQNHKTKTSSFGVNLYQPVDNYQRNTRSAKYAVLILFLTFITFFFVEILNKKRIHPVQYILVGLALTVFYTLLLSLSEQVGFNLAYLIASAIIVGMISMYAKSILASSKLAFILFAFFSLIYSFIFVILQLEDFALLVGSFGLVLVLGICMYLSRKVDWYGLKPKQTISHA